MTESEPPSHQNIVLKDLSTIKTEKVDENFTVENETLANKGSAATQSIPSLNNHYQSIVVKTEKIDQDLPKSENPSPMTRENKNSSATPPKIIQIKSCLPLNAGAPIRLMAPGASVMFPNRMISPSLIRPMIVRCVNKEGVPIRLPINLLRNAIVVRPSRLIRPGESLLRAPLLRPPISTCVPKAQPQPKPEVLNIPKTEIISRTNDKENFEDTVLAVEWLDTRDCVRKLAQNIHIIDSRANEPGFRSRHPFTCPSLETFASWNIGKQRSCEWLRARAIRELLSKCKIKQKEPLWSVKVILRWCRHHGYSPMTNNPIKPKPGTTASFDSTVTACQLKSLDNPDESDCVIDIESLPTGTRVPACSRVSETIILNSDDPDLTQWITQQLKKFGYQLSPEVCGDALVNFTSILFTRLWKSFADDLLRRSLSESWARQSGSNPDEITLADAFRAIVHRPEFDLFTNAGLCLPTDSTRSIN